MIENTQVIINKSKSRSENKDFNFSKDQIRITSSEVINSYRDKAWESFSKTFLPTIKDDPWRRTDLRMLKVDRFELATSNDSTKKDTIPSNLLKPLADGEHGGQILISGNDVRSYLDPALEGQGVIFTDLLTAELKYPQLVEKIIGKIVEPSEGKFAAMTGAFAQNGVFLYVPKNITIESPLHSLIWGSTIDFANTTHVMVYLEGGASVTYVHEVASDTETNGQSLQSSNIEMYVGPGSSLRFVELQSWGRHVWNFTHERVNVDRNGSVDWIFGAIGGHLTKNFAELNLIADGASGKMSGFYFTDQDQHLDYDSQQNHLAPHTTSDLLFKGALVEKSRSVWQGMIYVAPGADKTDGYQANRNLLLSRDARADSIPGLEILADDVRCTHGATVGKIDADQIFYLMARGIPRLEAERLIVEGFFDPIMQRIPFEGVRERFQQSITDKMKAYTG
ncbi:MAG: Fe-S cluster assembly protein SufD [Anaerolineaceae bacterium]